MSTSYKRLSFTNEEEEILIEFIKQHPALWDASHMEYGNGELRKIYWMSIATKLNKSVLECRRKWRFIRDYYVHKRRRASDSTPQRDGKYFSLHFLDKVSIRRFVNPNIQASKLHPNRQNEDHKKYVHRNNIERDTKIEQDFDDSEVEYTFPPDVTFEKVTMERIDQGHNFLLDDEDATTSQDQDTNDEPLADAISNEEYNYESSIADYVVTQKLDENEEEQLVEIRCGAEPELEQTKHSAVRMQERAIDLFFESMAAAVKTLPPRFVAEAKFKVFTAINELEMKAQSYINKK